ncbi:MAG TPA: UV DNA damage repair endonuclease UvsE [Firmicutes bacterium]|mgnify:CR=1 FL=1|nr:UV DNA damage repair endonuclease UvsE [Bacillota bacterium]
MNIGYACLALGVPGSEMKSCTRKNATEERLLSLIGHNLDALNTMIEYNIRNGIRLFRISSDLVPFGSSLAAELPWRTMYGDVLATIGCKIRNAGMRVSMHPGQYTVLNSPDGSVARRAVEDLEYHAKVLHSLGLGTEHKIVLHLGGAYGDKRQAIKRFISRYTELRPEVRDRLVLENDHRLFGIGDVLKTAIKVGIPVVYDNLHNAVNPTEESCTDLDWIKRCGETWTTNGGPQKVHYSQQHTQKKPGAHSDSIEVDGFLAFCQQLPARELDIMLEVKDKNLSALKCLNCISRRGISSLEAEWARYKYSILERSPHNYDAIRGLLREKDTYPAVEMYRLIEMSLSVPPTTGNAVNAAQHVWGYFKDRVSESDKARFQRAVHKFWLGETDLRSVKSTLLTLARKYQEEYLLTGYYLYL